MTDRSDPATLDELVGLDAHEATERATAAGWRVRALRPDTIVTLDYREDRANLHLAEDGTVLRVTIG